METYTQVAPNSTGNKIRNLQVTLLQADGTTATVLMQVIGMSDEAGNVIVPVSARDDDTMQTAILTELQAIRFILSGAFNIYPD